MDGRAFASTVIAGASEWSVLLTFIPRPRGFELAEVKVYPTSPRLRPPRAGWAASEAEASMPAGGIPVRLLRRALTEDLVRAAHAAVVRHVQQTTPHRLPLAYQEHPWPWLSALTLPTRRARVDRTPDGSLVRPGRASRPDFYYAIWAQRYVRALNAGSSSPVADVAMRHDMKPTQVRDLLREARRRELLTSLTDESTRDDLGRKRPPGLAGGQLTEKAIALLAPIGHDEKPTRKGRRQR
ncbi:MAG: hypothetical protein ACREA0_28900 [bacterium]